MKKIIKGLCNRLAACRTVIGASAVALGLLLGLGTSGIVKADNPIVQTSYTADPACMVYKDTFYVYTGHDADELVGNFYTMPGWKCFSSKDMVNWTDHGTVLAGEDFSWGKERFWASQCIEHEGKFYYYTCMVVQDGSGFGIGVAVADNPTGPFVDAIGAPLVKGSWTDIDPTVYVDDKGDAYLYYGQSLKYVKLNDDMISYDKSIGIVNVDTKNVGLDGYVEGPWFYQRNGLYYMVYAASGTGGAEQLSYSTSDSPTGPWDYHGTLMPTQGTSFTNHPAVADFNGHSYLVYHDASLPGGGSFHRSVRVDEFSYNDDGTIDSFDMTTEGPDAIASVNPYERVEAETICWADGVKTENLGDDGMNVCMIHDGDYIKVKNVDFGSTGAVKFIANVAETGAKGTIEMHLDSKTSKDTAAVLEIGDSGDSTFKDVSGEAGKTTGVHDVYIVFKSDSSDELFKLDYWKFEEEKKPEPTPTQIPDNNGGGTAVPTEAPISVPTAAPVQTLAPSTATAQPGTAVTTGDAAARPGKAQIKSFKIVKKGRNRKLTVGLVKLKNARKYEVVISLKRNFKKRTVKVISSNSCTFTKLVKNRTYYVRTRGYNLDDAGKKIYGAWSKTYARKMK